MGLRERLEEFKQKNKEDRALKKAEKHVYDTELRKHRTTARISAAQEAAKKEAKRQARERWKPATQRRGRLGGSGKRGLANLKGIGSLDLGNLGGFDAPTRKKKKKVDTFDIIDF